MFDAFLPSKDENFFGPVPPENQKDILRDPFQNPLNPGFGEQLSAFDNPVSDFAIDPLWQSVLESDETDVDRTLVDLLTGEALQNFAADPNFTDKISLAFGDNWNRETIRELQQDWLSGDFSDIPDVRILSADVLPAANGAYSSQTDTIYLSRDFLTENAANPAAIADVLLEEYGHAIDAKINTVDAAGDEGEIFASVVRGEALSDGELLALKVEDDSGVITLDGEEIQLEKATLPWSHNWRTTVAENGIFNVGLIPFDNLNSGRGLIRKDAPQTWVVVHGFRDSPYNWNINNLAKGLDEIVDGKWRGLKNLIGSKDQVLVVDWRQGDARDLNDYWTGASRTDNVGNAVASLLIHV